MTDAPLKPFAASYRCDGRRWAVTLYATSFSDAERRLALMAYGRVEGEIVAAIDEDHRLQILGRRWRTVREVGLTGAVVGLAATIAVTVLVSRRAKAKLSEKGIG